MIWTYYPGIRNVQAPLSCTGDYVISHRRQQHTLSYRPPGQHRHVGTFETRQEAKRAAELHASCPLRCAEFAPTEHRCESCNQQLTRNLAV